MDRGLIQQIRRLDRHDLRRVLILARGLLVAMGDEAGTPAEDPEHGVTYRSEAVRCGKPGCTKCPHGPYWYAYYREDGKLRSRYVGRELPADVIAALAPEGTEPD
ncbi:MAG TPA: hypothetical protein VFK89_09450 [Actinomycetota bacterium]|nr:hypothetical protein [Actinomycetota bacterium]